MSLQASNLSPVQIAVGAMLAAALAGCGGGNGGSPSESASVAGVVQSAAFGVEGSGGTLAATSAAESSTLSTAATADLPAAGTASADALSPEVTALAVNRSSLTSVESTIVATALSKGPTAADLLQKTSGKNLMVSMGTLPTVNAAKIPVRALGFATEQTQPTSELPVPTDVGAFRTTCGLSHMSFDDPIVYPGQPGRAHLHMFFGNTGATANSTAASIASTGNSTCRGGTVNRTSYWAPAMIDTRDGSPVPVSSMSAYYKTGYYGVLNSEVNPFPAGLRIIAGDPSASADHGGPGDFTCDGAPNTKNIPDCQGGPGRILQYGIEFPQCWDGVNLDSPDHKSHMSYPQWNDSTRRMGCPADHPVALPLITVLLVWDIPADHATARWRLSSDSYSTASPGGYSSHADWFNGWKPEVLSAWVNGCVRASKDCHEHLLGDGRMMY